MNLSYGTICTKLNKCSQLKEDIMTQYIITTESGSDLPKEFIDRHNIYIIPMHVTMGDKTYEDGSFKVEKAFEYYEKTGTLPKTSGSTPQDNTNIFEEVRAEYPDAHIIHIAYSAVTTVSYKAAQIAAEEFENIHLVDAKHVTFGLTAVVKATAEFIEENPEATPDEIISYVEDVRERTKMVFLPKTLLYLRAGGRVSNLAYHGANLLKLQPTIILENGYLVSGKKYRGSFERSLTRTMNDFFSTYDIEPDSVLIGGAPGVTDSQKQMVIDIAKENGITNPVWRDTGAVISCHGGPGAVGIAGIIRA